MKQLTSFALSSLFVSLVGCGDNAEPDPLHPETCMAAGKDGPQTLYVGGDEKKPWDAYCHKGDEYLPVEAGTNIGSFRAGGLASGTDVTTEYAKLRIDPITLTIDISDQTFAKSTGALALGSQHITSMPLGVAMACEGSASRGFANINLKDTPFRVVSRFAVGDTKTGTAAPAGHASFHVEDQWIESWAEGECGFIGPAGMSGTPGKPLADGWVLKVQWFVPTF